MDNMQENDFYTDEPLKEKEEKNAVTPKSGRQGYIQEEIKKMKPKKDEEEPEKGNILIYLVIIVIVVLIVFFGSMFVMKIIGNRDSNTNKPNISKNDSSNKTDNNTNITNKDDGKKEENNNLAITSTTDVYNAYPVSIESVVQLKAGNFFDNNKRIKGDKVYVEYKQIKGLKDKTKQENLNTKLKEMVVAAYDRNYLGDTNILYVDIYTKLSVNLGAISYAVNKTVVDINGKVIVDEVKTLNLKLDTMEEIKFKELFVDGANIKNIYADYKETEKQEFYFDPEKIEVYSKEKIVIEMSKNMKDIAAYKRFKETSDMFEGSSVSQKVYTILKTSVSEETKDRAFEKN